MQAAAALTAVQQRLEAEVRRLLEDKASLQTQAQRVLDLEQQLQATNLATAEASQVGTQNMSSLSRCAVSFESQLLFCSVPTLVPKQMRLHFTATVFALILPMAPFCCPLSLVPRHGTTDKVKVIALLFQSCMHHAGLHSLIIVFTATHCSSACKCVQASDGIMT